MVGTGQPENQFRLLEGSMDALGMRAHLADTARHTLDVQYYILHDGLTTRMLIQRLLDAADRGVRVRLLLDDMTSHGHDARIAALSCHENIEVRLFNPIESGRTLAITRFLTFMARIQRMHRRMHNKLWIADGELAITGGRNLGDEYYGASSEMNFSDLDLLCRGPLVEEMQASFNQYWNSPFVMPVANFRLFVPSIEEHRLWRLRVVDRMMSAMREREDYVSSLRQWQRDGSGARILEEMLPANAMLLVDSPEKIGTPEPPPLEELVFSPLIERVRAVRNELVLVSAYFVPGEIGIELLGELAARGVRVRVLTNSLAATDLPLVHGGYVAFRQRLLQAGVELYEMRAHPDKKNRWRHPLRGSVSLHSKAMIFDRQSAFVGSFNMDPRSAFWNTEIGVLLESPTLAKQLFTLADQAMVPETSYQLKLHEGRVRWHFSGPSGPVVQRFESGAPWRRLLAWFSARFAPAEWL
ncbi:MAG: phospholipase D family protein [Alcanivoracaceae bacterium]|jgi:putative cardiolipin synthase|nr:phospholipase D family protein [Alcanivoracaceae bacterium]